MPRVPLLAALLLVIATLVGCGTPTVPSPSVAVAPPGVDPETVALLATHGLTPAGPTDVQDLPIGDPAEQPWSLYLEVSRAIGLDFSAAAGQGAQLRSTPVVHPSGELRVHVLVREGVPIGAWLSHASSTPGIYPLTDPP